MISAHSQFYSAQDVHGLIKEICTSLLFHISIFICCSNLSPLSFNFPSFLQVTSPYPLSVVRTSTTTTSAVYKLSLLPDYHSPPEPPFTNLTISFLSPLAQQEELISVTFAESDPSCDTAPSISLPKDSKTDTSDQDQEKKHSQPAPDSSSNKLGIIAMSIFFCVLMLLVMCVALQKTSTNSKSGFPSHLPPGGKSPLHSTSLPYSPVTSPQQSMHAPIGPGVYPTSSTPNIVSPSGSNVASPHQTPFGLPSSACRRTRSSSSPKQHGLFSQ